MARLFVLSGNFIGSTFDFHETSTVGRGDGADIVIAEASISRKHARLVPRSEPGRWKVVDLDSSNGVFVGGKRVRSGVVGDGDTFRLGEVELRLRDAAEDGEAGAEDLFGDEDEDPGFDPSDDEPEGVGRTPSGGEPGDDDASDGGFELEFGDDLDDAIATKSGGASVAPSSGTRSAGGSPQAAKKTAAQARARTAAPASDRAGARASAQRAQRRQEVLKGGAASVGASNPSGGGKPVLQYSGANQRSSGVDLSQMSAGMRALVLLLGLALMGGIAYGAFSLTRTARTQSAVLSE